MLTVQSQLNRLVLVVIGAVVLLMSTAFFLFEYVSYRNDAVENIYPMAETLGIHLRPCLVVPNRAQAQEILATTSGAQDIVAAYLLDRHDRPFSYYKHPHPFLRSSSVDATDNLLGRDELAAILATGERSYRIAGNYLAIFVPIREGGEKLGTLYLVLSLKPFYLRIFWWFFCALGIVAAAVALGTFLASRLQRGIVEPVTLLSRHMARVSAGELPGPLEIAAVGEMRTLIEGFNAMLERIATHERNLEEANANLEERVLSRTAELGRSELRYRSLFEDSPISLWEEDFSAVVVFLQGLKARGVNDLATWFREHPEDVASCAALVRIVDINTRTLKLYRAPDRQALIGQLDSIFTASSFETFTQGLVAVAAGETTYTFEGTNRTLEGNEIDIALHFAVVPGHENDYRRVVISIEDITARKTLERELHASLKEKDLLLQEVHHRVKNNLQIISSLINLQIKNLGGNPFAAELHSTLLRVRAMALIHEKLYRSQPGSITLEAFIFELAHEILALYGEEAGRITLDLAIAPITASVDQGMTIAIIINELLTNALKYAFPDGRSGVVGIGLHHDSDGIVLMVRDNGIGLPLGFEPSRQKSLGYRLLLNLAEQVQGRLSVTGDNNGTCVTLHIARARLPGRAT